MRSTTCFVVFLGSLNAVLAAGCFDETLCDVAVCTGAGGASSSATASTATSSSASMSSSSSSISAECDPGKLGATATLSATCGLFVEPGHTGGDGSQGSPYGSLSEAIAANPMARPIYVCATGATLSDTVTLSAAEQLIGGVTCGDWKATATKTAWTASANAIPLTFDHTSGAVVRRFSITSAAASGFDGGSLQGASSIAVIADNAVATLESVSLSAGAGAAGGDAMDQVGKAPGRQNDAVSFDGHVGGGCNMAGGPAQDYMTCPAGGGLTEGGKGGDGANAVGSAGNAGSPALGGGAAGTGDTGAVGWDCFVNAGNGGFGGPGVNGTGGPGGTGPGAINGGAYVGPKGTPGTVGGIGQGGGGGGGRRKSVDGCSTTGASGGSGGAGGCGGLGGAGGGAGGASIALFSVNSTLTLTDVHLTASDGGAGGTGGDGQGGGNGGFGAGGGGSACKGGDGGKGGDGAGGGGGKGGPSIGLASVGPATAPAVDDANIAVSMTPSMGGAAGGGNIPGLQGDAGDTLKQTVFP